MNTTMTKAPFCLGSLLCHYNLINLEQLENALSLHFLSKKPLGQILVEHSFITPWQLERVLACQRLLICMAFILNVLFCSNARAQTDLLTGEVIPVKRVSPANIEQVIIESRTGWNLPTILNQADAGDLKRYKIVGSGNKQFSFIFSDPSKNSAREMLVGEFQMGVDADKPGFRYQAAISKKAVVLKMKYQF